VSDRPLRIVLAGMVAGDPHQGGATWAVLQYALGLRRLGHEVTLVEPVASPTAEQRAYFGAVTSGIDARLGGAAPEADVLLNVSGMLRDGIERIPIRVYVDLDPVFNQLWHIQGIDAGFEGHTHYASVGLRLPKTGHEWIHTLPPVVLERWPVAAQVELDAWTTVGNWRSYGTLEHEGVRYGQKAHSLRQLIDLPQLTSERFALALAIHDDELRDLELLRSNGWELLDPRAVAGTPEAYAAFVQGSKGELGIAKEGYVVSSSGWFSDRSACYLASGRPVIAQDSGFGEALPVGAGLLAFSSADDVLAAIENIASDYGRHSRAARAIAEEFFDSDVVLRRLLRAVGALPPDRHGSIHHATERELAALVGATAVRHIPFAYRTSAPMAELDADGRRLLLKDVSQESLTPRARAAKPDFLRDSRREPFAYREYLAGTGAPELVAYDEEKGWLVIEKVEGVELYQVGELEAWAEALIWLARFHERFADTPHSEPLLRYDRAFFEIWPERADSAPAGYADVIERLAQLPTTLVHGELYASNVLVAPGRVCPVDWELAGIGPGVLDVAALTAGWPDEERSTLIDAYRSASKEPPDRDDVDRAALHLSVQWLGWSPDWTPTPENALDWRAEIAKLVEALGL
jgi:aminoglycoside/choline kinase family phosphotransferase